MDQALNNPSDIEVERINEGLKEIPMTPSPADTNISQPQLHYPRPSVESIKSCQKVLPRYL